MNTDHDQQQIRDLIHTWIRASAANDLDTVLSLMAEDVVFLRPGHPPMRGREAFAAASRGMAGKFQIEGTPDIQEIVVDGDHAYCWNHLNITVTPTDGGPTKHNFGPILCVFRRDVNGRWVLFRDANMLTPV